MSGVPGRLIIQYGQVTTYNANRPHGFGILDPETFAPYSKNPVIGAFFREIDRADELGSGMRKLMKYGKKYGGADPMRIEGDVFRMIIRVPEFGGNVALSGGIEPVSAPDGVHGIRLTETMKKILILLTELQSTPQLLAQPGYHRRTRNYEAAIKHLLASELIAMTFPDTPRSKNQKYRLTEKGRKLLEILS